MDLELDLDGWIWMAIWTKTRQNVAFFCSRRKKHRQEPSGPT
jgi:hypothetical protein